MILSINKEGYVITLHPKHIEKVLDISKLRLVYRTPAWYKRGMLGAYASIMYLHSYTYKGYSHTYISNIRTRIYLPGGYLVYIIIYTPIGLHTHIRGATPDWER